MWCPFDIDQLAKKENIVSAALAPTKADDADDEALGGLYICLYMLYILLTLIRFQPRSH